MWKKEKVLITVKTYPNLSNTYEELVCTAGIREDGSWIRLYPIPYRQMDYGKQFEKYRWIEVLVRKHRQDERPESHEPRCDTFQMGKLIGTDKGGWRERKEHVLREVHTDLGHLIERAHNNQLSLAVFKPDQFVDFEREPVPEDKRAEHKAKMERIMARRKQLNLMDDEPRQIKLADQPDYNFYYIIKDSKGKKSRMQIEDWEIHALYRNCLPPNDPSSEDKELAAEKVYQLYWEDHALTKDIHLFLGTTLQYHRKKASNPFMIVGTFYPKKEAQNELF